MGFFFFGASLKKNQSLFKLGVVSHRKTTYRFRENNVSFWKKQRVVLEKTTARFEENNVSFWRKQRIVLEKTTCRFNDNDSLFFIGYAEGKRTIGESEIDNAKRICKNTYNQPLSRVRVRAHITGVFVFLLSQVSQGIYK